MRYFKKINPKQKFLGSYGQWIEFPDFGNGFGGIATDNAKTIRELELTMSKSVGGVSEITAKEFEDLKKKQPSSQRLNGEHPANLRSLVNRLNTDHPNRLSDVVAEGDRNSRALKLPNREESLLMPSEPAKPTGFRPKALASR